MSLLFDPVREVLARVAQKIAALDQRIAAHEVVRRSRRPGWVTSDVCFLPSLAGLSVSAMAITRAWRRAL